MGFTRAALALAAVSPLVACGPRAAKWPYVDPSLGPAPPRAESPASKATTNEARPRFTWELAPGIDGARLELCRDLECLKKLESIDAKTSAQPAANLPTG